MKIIIRNIKRKSLRYNMFQKLNHAMYLKLVSANFYQIFIYSPNDSLSKTEKCFLFHLKSSSHSRDIQIFAFFALRFNTLEIQNNKWKWNN